MLDFPGMLWYHNIRPRDKDKNKTRNERNDSKILDELRKISKKRGFVKKVLTKAKTFDRL